jgi:hypothetical protein
LLTLKIDRWEAKPGMKDLLFRNQNGNNQSSMIIQPIDECIEVRHALQEELPATTTNTTASSRTKTVVLGDVQEALGNEELYDTILALAESAVQRDSSSLLVEEVPRDEDEEEEALQTEPSIIPQQQDPIQLDKECIDDSDATVDGEESEEDESMNIRDMLATQPEDVTQQEPASQEEEEAPMNIRDLLATQHEDITQQQEPASQKEDEESMDIREMLATQPDATQEPDASQNEQAAETLEHEFHLLSTQPPLEPQPPPPNDEESHLSPSSRKRRAAQTTVEGPKRRRGLWQSLVQQLQDTTSSIITLPIDKPKTALLRHGLSRWLVKNTVEHRRGHNA